ncbi:helicase-related protein [Prauserella shujinwangii]|uniref:DEAD/DEAH box helicase n=1 Tax=Prauserella shujinwangii TaxID=1453103 RepID=UPI000D0586A4|nr:helicase-related protein [Prauserella shujinwangii]
MGSPERFRLRLHALFLKHAYKYDPISALSSARIEPELHQVFVAHRVTSKLAPRMILADEVGLGKTIEAGLILKELRARGLVDRVLVCVPASLQLQWQRELESKFNERFEIIDGAAAKHFGRGGKNPFQAQPNVICSHSFAIRDPRAEQITEVPWDLVIFDEAHRVRRNLRGGKTESTKLYELAEQLKESSHGMLLLTATPMQLSPFELWSSIELVEPGLYPSYERYRTKGHLLPALNEVMRCVQGWGALNPQDKAAFRRSEAARTLRSLIDVSPDLAELEDPERRDRLRRELIEAHPLTQVLIRNRKVNIGGFTRRIAYRLPVTLSPAEQDVQERVSGYLRDGYRLALRVKNQPLGFLMVTYHKMLASSSHAIRGSLQRRLTMLEDLRERRATPPTWSSSREQDLRDTDTLSDAVDELGGVVDPESLDHEIAQLTELVALLGQLRDSKARGLLSLLAKTAEREPGAKVLVFTQFIETQRFLQQALQANGFPAEIFNGRMALDEKERAVDAFRHGAQVLISTESGGEGRNFQFAHILVNYDLPWNPMRVEQRIGRLDRIGQRRDVLIYNLASEGTVEDRVLELLEERIGLFETSVGSLDPILGRVERDIEQIVMTAHDLSAELKDYGAKDLSQRLAEAQEKESALADFVLDEASLRHDEAKRLLADADPYARAQDLEQLAADILDHYGGALTRTDEGEVAITVSPGLAAKIRAADRVSVGVFDPKDALRLEHRPFFAFGHRLIDALVELPINDHPVTASVQRRDDVTEPQLELTYELVTTRPINQGVLIRHVVTADLRVSSAPVKSPPPVGAVVIDAEIPTWVSAALDASRETIRGEFAGWRADMAERDAAVRAQRLEREKRVHDDAVQRMSLRITEFRERVSDLQRRGSAQQRRIIPAVRGQIERTKERIAEREAVHETRMREIETQESSSDFKLLAASLVVPS